MLDPMNSVPAQFAQLRTLWFGVLFFYANRLFFLLATVEIGLGALLWVVQQQGVEAIGAGLLKKVLWIGFLYAVLFNAQTWIPAVIDSFIQAGQDASGVKALNPSEVMWQGIGVAVKMLYEMAGWGIFKNFTGLLTGIFAAFVVVVSFAVIAIELAVTLIESYIVTGAGVFLLGFAAFRGTAAVSERYLGYVVAVGIKLLALYLIVGGGATLAPEWGKLINETNMLNYWVPLTILGAALLYAVVAWRVPSVAGALASGTVALGFHDVLGATVMATRTVAGAGTAATAGGMGAATVASAAQLGRAIAQGQGGGWRGAALGLKEAGSALSREAVAAAVPRLHRARQNIQRQAAAITNLNNDDGHQF